MCTWEKSGISATESPNKARKEKKIWFFMLTNDNDYQYL